MRGPMCGTPSGASPPPVPTHHSLLLCNAPAAPLRQLLVQLLAQLLGLLLRVFPLVACVALELAQLPLDLLLGLAALDVVAQLVRLVLDLLGGVVRLVAHVVGLVLGVVAAAAADDERGRRGGERGPSPDRHLWLMPTVSARYARGLLGFRSARI